MEMTSAKTSLPFTPVNHQWTGIKNYSGTFSNLSGNILGLDCNEVTNIGLSFYNGNHISPNRPTSAELVLNHGVKANLDLIFKCMECMLRDVGLKLMIGIDLNQIESCVSEPTENFRHITPESLEIRAYAGVSIYAALLIQNSIPTYTSSMWLLVLNPRFVARLNSKDLHGMVIPGLSLPDEKTVLIVRDGDTVYCVPIRKSTVMKTCMVVPSYSSFLSK